MENTMKIFILTLPVRRPPSAVRRSHGFTIIEVLIVLALLIVVVALALPLLNRSSSFARARADSYDIAGKLTQAKFRAATDLTVFRVRFDLANNNYVLERREAGTFVQDGPVLPLRNVISYATPEDLSDFASVPADGEQATPAVQSVTITFNSRGIPIDSSGKPLPDNAVYLVNDRNDFFAITVSLAGLVEVWRYLPDGTWVPPQ
jgi:prepilin-type N-terminal cleavage/methylation domain-containing protein